MKLFDLLPFCYYRCIFQDVFFTRLRLLFKLLTYWMSIVLRIKKIYAILKRSKQLYHLRTKPRFCTQGYVCKLLLSSTKAFGFYHGCTYSQTIRYFRNRWVREYLFLIQRWSFSKIFKTPFLIQWCNLCSKRRDRFYELLVCNFTNLGPLYSCFLLQECNLKLDFRYSYCIMSFFETIFWKLSK